MKEAPQYKNKPKRRRSFQLYMQNVKCQIAFAQALVGEAISRVPGCSRKWRQPESFVLGVLLYLVGRYDDAVDELQRSLKLNESNQSDTRERGVHDNNGFQLLDILARAQFHSGDAAAAIATLDSPLARQFNRYPAKYAASLALLGRTEEARQAVDEMIQRDRLGTGDTVAVSLGFWAYFYLGDFDEAFVWMNRGIENREVFLIGSLRTSPLLDSLRDDPRFNAAMARLEEIEASESSIFVPVAPSVATP